MVTNNIGRRAVVMANQESPLMNAWRIFFGKYQKGQLAEGYSNAAKEVKDRTYEVDDIAAFSAHPITDFFLRMTVDNIYLFREAFSLFYSAVCSKIAQEGQVFEIDYRHLGPLNYLCAFIGKYGPKITLGAIGMGGDSYGHGSRHSHLTFSNVDYGFGSASDKMTAHITRHAIEAVGRDAKDFNITVDGNIGGLGHICGENNYLEVSGIDAQLAARNSHATLEYICKKGNIPIRLGIIAGVDRKYDRLETALRCLMFKEFKGDGVDHIVYLGEQPGQTEEATGVGAPFFETCVKTIGVMPEEMRPQYNDWWVGSQKEAQIVTRLYLSCLSGGSMLSLSDGEYGIFELGLGNNSSIARRVNIEA